MDWDSLRAQESTAFLEQERVCVGRQSLLNQRQWAAIQTASQLIHNLLFTLPS